MAVCIGNFYFCLDLRALLISAELLDFPQTVPIGGRFALFPTHSRHLRRPQGVMGMAFWVPVTEGFRPRRIPSSLGWLSLTVLIWTGGLS